MKRRPLLRLVAAAALALPFTGRFCRRRRRPGGRAGEDRRAPLAVGHDGDQRDVAPRCRADGRRGDQRRRRCDGRRRGPHDRAGRRRPRLGLAALRREGQGADRPGRRRDLRLLDQRLAEVGPPGDRRGERAALLPRAVRGRGAEPQRLLHRLVAQPAARARRRVRDQRAGQPEVLPARHRLRVPAHGQPRAEGLPPRGGRARGEHHGGVHALRPPGLPDDRLEDQAVQRQRRRGGALDDQRQLERALLHASSPTRASPPATCRSSLSRCPRTSCGRWTRASWWATSRRGTTSRASTAPRTRSSSRPSKRTAKRTTCPAAPIA